MDELDLMIGVPQRLKPASFVGCFGTAGSRAPSNLNRADRPGFSDPNRTGSGDGLHGPQGLKPVSEKRRLIAALEASRHPNTPRRLKADALRHPGDDGEGK